MDSLPKIKDKHIVVMCNLCEDLKTLSSEAPEAPSDANTAIVMCTLTTEFLKKIDAIITFPCNYFSAL